MEFIRLEGEIENKSKLALLIMKLDGKTIKLSGFPESLKVRAAETKVTFPVRHDWDSYFRDARNMNELRPGERPDTIHLQDLPTRWFAKRSDKTKSPDQRLKPCEDIVRRVFETFGEVRCVDIPVLDPYRKEIMGSMAKPGTIQTFNYGQDINFEAYVQFKEYISFVKAMDALRGMKLLYKEDDDKALSANIKVREGVGVVSSQFASSCERCGSSVSLFVKIHLFVSLFLFIFFFFSVVFSGPPLLLSSFCSSCCCWDCFEFEQKTWQVMIVEKINVFVFDLKDSREGFCQRGRGKV